MNSKNHSRIIAAICIGVMAAFSIFVFPFVLAASPGNMEIEVIEMEDDFNVKEPDPVPEHESVIEPGLSSAPEANLEIKPEPDPIPIPSHEPAIDPNAISEEQAIALAWELYMFPEAEDTTPAGETRGYRTAFVEARYIENQDPASDPSWFLLFEYRYWGTMFAYIPRGYTQEEYLLELVDGDVFGTVFSIGTDNFGVPVVKWEYSGSHNEMIEINALTGEWIRLGMNPPALVLDDDPVYNKDIDEFASWDNIKQGMDWWWWSIEKNAAGEIVRHPLHEENSDQGG